MKHRKQTLLRNHSPPNAYIWNTLTNFKKQINNMRTLFFFLVLATSFSLNAQITKGNWLVGGNGSFSSSTATSEDNSGNKIESKATGLRLNPNIGYFLADKIAFGLDTSINFSNPQGNENSSWTLGLGPFIRYYFFDNDKIVNLFSEANYIFSSGISEQNNDLKSSAFGLSVGGVLFFNSSVGLELSLNYTDSKTRRDGSADANFNNLQIALGFQIHLKK